VLEIGSGFGYFLRQIAPRLLPRERVVAVEYNDHARERLAQEGFVTYGDDIRSPRYDALRGRFEAVFLFQVLEHMDGLADVVRRLDELLRPGGSVYVAVPNGGRIEFNETH